MATEATSDIIAKPSISPDHVLKIDETTSQNVLPEQSFVNGVADKHDSKQDTENAEPNVNSAEVSVSGGSDTEASKAEASKGQVDEKGHVRTTSTLKKFASFKPVSVNKTFLAAKGSTSAVPSKLGDKGASGATATQTGPTSSIGALRPRLVAKTVSGLRDSTPRAAAAANGSKAGAAPDASAVWNKNRPAPPPEPKRVTDEELKQRFGIHLATRLQQDDPGKQANWADIDDDDDDWAPETIEWTDGTKITLAHADDAPAPSLEPAPSSKVKEVVAPEIMKPKSPVSTALPSASPTVKPSGFGSGRAGLILKAAGEKPTLVAKPPGPPTPVKSPWASLPPVDKVAPVTTEPQQQPSQQSRFGQRDPHGFNGMPPPPPPAKEIAADDFSRSWREGTNTSRELYNSQSGRYEPVNDARRGSLRNDSRSHQPAVLQRPTQDGHPEPSSAFQTHRAGQDGGYGRRRTSSNVSGGSGNFVRRMSRGHDMSAPQEALNIRRGSLAAVSDEPSSPRNFSPSGQQHGQRGHQNQQQWQPQSRASPVVSHQSPLSVHGQTVPPVSATSESQNSTLARPFEDPIEEQKKIMRQTRELAIKRRLEEEARDDAARKERIRIKLEAMGPPPEKKKRDAIKEEASTSTQIQIQSREATSVVPTQTEEPGRNHEGESKAAKVVELQKVHQEPSLATPTEAKPVQNRPQDDIKLVNGVQSGRPMNQQPSQDGRSSTSWHNNAASTSDRMKSWSAVPGPQTSSMNVWGPPTNDRTLGNGTFNPELSRLPEVHQSTHPGPIGPPQSSRGGNQFQHGRSREPYGSRPAPIGPPNRQLPMSRQDIANRAAVANSGWGNLPEKLAQDDALGAQQREKELARRREMVDQGITPEANVPVISETWRKVAINEDGTRGKIQGNIKTIHDPSQQWNGHSEKPQEESATRSIFEDHEPSHRRHLDPISSQPPFVDAWRAQTNQAANPAAPARGSRFFPTNRDVRLEEQNQFDRPGSPSPPPPTMAGHPAYDGDVARPHVSLPRPPPVVKLPPAPVLAPIGPPKPTSFAQAVQAPAVPLVSHNPAYPPRQDPAARANSSYQDNRRQEPAVGGWQDRINSLIGRKNSPPKTHALAVDSSSKNAFELTNRQFGATVSLPALNSEESAADNGAAESKPAAEACFEEQEMGSLPVIKVPNSAPAAAWELAPSQPKNLPRKFQVAQVLSVEPIRFPQQIANNNETITIKVPGQNGSKEVFMQLPLARQRSNPRRGGARGGTPRHASSSHSRGGRGRDSSHGFPSPNHDSSLAFSGTNSPGRGGRGARGYGTSWGRHSSTPLHT
ncbi:related to PAN1-actin-cytoskeleton assembly protein [Rhynchosporium agropyri]|uniref:Related to PAN1-actin-cytoskeleton assembly protein n=1 Tax=Rhynchosporium agropyri TaxID=914238 RepID=A0A1E1LA04_9HELO|nr:related to PAN1-actin-cytoskeleton assembly protein [Rhynchosporium agropyri]